MAIRRKKRKKARPFIPINKLSKITPFQIQEAYKLMRTNLMFSLSAKENNAIVFSSPMPSEGKSTTCSNLAITMAQTGAKTLLVDADLRKPVQHKVFRVNNAKGLTTLLAGFDTLAEVLHANVESNLDLIPSGPIPPNPSELLGGENMGRLLVALQENYDYIFLDTPPINVVTDALVLSRQTAGVVLVGRQKQTTHDELSRAIAALEFAGVSILGLVVNGMKEKHRLKSYKYKYQYAYRESK